MKKSCVRHACRRHCIIAAGLLRELNYWFEIYLLDHLSRQQEGRTNFFSKNKRNHVSFRPFRFRALLGELLAKVPVFHEPVVQNSTPQRNISTFFLSARVCPFSLIVAIRAQIWLPAFLAKQRPFWLTTPYTKRSKSPTQELPSKLLHLIPSRQLSAFLAIAEQLSGWRVYLSIISWMDPSLRS